MNWYNISPDSDTAHVQFNGEIGIGGKTADDFEIELCAHNPKTLSVTINSPGGNWPDGLKLFSILQKYPTVVEIVGRCYSTAILAAMAAQTIRIARDATVLIHSPCRFVHGNAEQLLEAALDIEQSAEQGAEIIRQRTRNPAHIVKYWMSRDSYFTASEAISHGIADELLPAPKVRAVSPHKAEAIRRAAPTTTEEEQAFRFWLSAFGPLQVGCREKFAVDLQHWFHSNVRQAEPDLAP